LQRNEECLRTARHRPAALRFAGHGTSPTEKVQVGEAPGGLHLSSTGRTTGWRLRRDEKPEPTARRACAFSVKSRRLQPGVSLVLRHSSPHVLRRNVSSSFLLRQLLLRRYRWTVQTAHTFILRRSHMFPLLQKHINRTTKYATLNSTGSRSSWEVAVTVTKLTAN
jgi:hypothetical protein